MALGTRADFEKHSGDDLDLVVTVTDEDGAAISVSGATAVRWQLGRLREGEVSPRQPGQPLVAYSLGSGVEMIAGGASGLRVSIAGDDTAALRGGDYYHELELTLSGVVTTILYGIATLHDDLAT